MMQKLEEIMTKDTFGLYRDDGLGVIRGSGQQSERINKKIFKIIQEEGLNITAEANIKSVEFLDVTMSLDDGSFRPFNKANSTIKYVSKESNHPTSLP